VERIVTQLRQRWPRGQIVLRADSGFSREELMAWCECHQVDHVFGLARNQRLEKMLGAQMQQARARHQSTGKAARVFTEFSYRTRKSWSRSRRVVAKAVLPRLTKGMLCLADRSFFGFGLWQQAQGTGADLLWRMKKNMRLACEQRLPDGSYLSHVYPSERDWRHKTNGIAVRVIDYRLEGIEGAEPIYRLATTIVDPDQAPTSELAALDHERWEIETAFDELKTHLRGARIVLRSKTPDLVRQEFYGLLMAHFAIRGLMHEAALQANQDPDRLSFLHAVRVVRRKLALYPTIPPRNKRAFHDAVLHEILQERVVSSRHRRNSRGVKRKLSNFPLRPRRGTPLPPIDIGKAIRIIK